jgi:microcystin degradation protein MlrC
MHFAEDLLVYGDAVKNQLECAAHEVGGFFEVLEEEGIQAVPVFAARAYPFGVVALETFEELVATILDGLKAVGPVDGVLAAPHGLVVSEKHIDGDGWWLSRVREWIGPDVPLIAALDLQPTSLPRSCKQPMLWLPIGPILTWTSVRQEKRQPVSWPALCGEK